MTLLCVNCLAVYADTFGNVASPSCPHCGVSWYEDVDLQAREPQRAQPLLGSGSCVILDVPEQKGGVINEWEMLKEAIMKSQGQRP